MSKNEIQQAIQQAFDAGWAVGKYEGQSQPISMEQLIRDCLEAFQTRDRLIKKFETKPEFEGLGDH